jgi:hypothetical protein
VKKTSYICIHQQQSNNKSTNKQSFDVEYNPKELQMIVQINSGSEKLKSQYKRRLDFLQNKWQELMQEQDTLPLEVVASDEFQNRKKRIARLYQRLNRIVNQPKKEIIHQLLESAYYLNITPDFGEINISIS